MLGRAVSRCVRNMWAGGQMLVVFAVLTLAESTCPNTCDISPCSCNLFSVLCSNQGCSDFSHLQHCDLSGVTNIFFNGNVITKLSKGDFAIFPDATGIDLQNNKIAEIQEEVFSDVPQLISLSLNGNEIKMLPSLNLPNVIYLYLNNNPISISGTIEAPNLMELNLADCKLSNFNNILSKTSKLNNLDLSYNELTELNSEWFATATVITTLDISHNQLESLHISGNNLNSLLDLDLSYNKQLKDFDGEVFKNMPSLQTLNLEGTSPSTPSNGPLLSHDSITILSLASCELTKELPAATFSELPQLQYLDLSNNKLFEVESVFNSSASLRVLILSANGLQFISDGVFAGTPQLEELYLNDNSAIDSFQLSTIEHLKSLRILDVSNTRFACYCSYDHWLLDRWARESGIDFRNTCGSFQPCDWDNIVTTTEAEVKCWDAAGFCSDGEKCCPTGICAKKCAGVCSRSALSLASAILLGILVMQIK